MIIPDLIGSFFLKIKVISSTNTIIGSKKLTIFLTNQSNSFAPITASNFLITNSTPYAPIME
jgi:hypothetical protein